MASIMRPIGAMPSLFQEKEQATIQPAHSQALDRVEVIRPYVPEFDWMLATRAGWLDEWGESR
jgi:hypothetical protein